MPACCALGFYRARKGCHADGGWRCVTRLGPGWWQSLDGFELFSSANQLSMIKEVVYSSPYDDGINQDDDPIDFDELISDEVAIAYFPLHHDSACPPSTQPLRHTCRWAASGSVHCLPVPMLGRAVEESSGAADQEHLEAGRVQSASSGMQTGSGLVDGWSLVAGMRLKLLNEWARPVSKPQPLELIREYFGEKIALYYTWFGYYITMLFIPGLTGSALFATQMFYFPLTGTLENPFTPVYAIVMSIWAAAFAQLWQSLENTRKYQWDTLEFENQESVREEFKEAEETLKVNPTP